MHLAAQNCMLSCDAIFNKALFKEKIETIDEALCFMEMLEARYNFYVLL